MCKILKIIYVYLALIRLIEIDTKGIYYVHVYRPQKQSTSMTTMNECWRYGVKSVYAYAYIFDLLKNISNTRKRCVCWCNSFGRTIWVKIKLISLCKVLVFILVFPKFQPMCLALSIKCTC